MKKLMISQNCGISYEEEMRSENINDFKEKIDYAESNMLRWVIENEEGRIEDFCSIHKNILNTLEILNSRRQI